MGWTCSALVALAVGPPLRTHFDGTVVDTTCENKMKDDINSGASWVESLMWGRNQVEPSDGCQKTCDPGEEEGKDPGGQRKRGVAASAATASLVLSPLTEPYFSSGAG